MSNHREFEYHYPGDQPAEFIYHYHGFSVVNGGQEHVDGIAVIGRPVSDINGYRELKKKIEPDLGDRLIITSLSLLGRVSEYVAVGDSEV